MECGADGDHSNAAFVRRWAEHAACNAFPWPHPGPALQDRVDGWINEVRETREETAEQDPAECGVARARMQSFGASVHLNPVYPTKAGDYTRCCKRSL